MTIKNINKLADKFAKVARDTTFYSVMQLEKVISKTGTTFYNCVSLTDHGKEYCISFTDDSFYIIDFDKNDTSLGCDILVIQDYALYNSQTAIITQIAMMIVSNTFFEQTR